MNEQEQPRRRRHRLYRTSADWFGIAAMGLLMICSLVLLVQLMSTKLLTDLYLILIEIVLLLINAGHVIIQLPIRRVKTSKLVCGLLAVILSGLMLYGSVAAASGKSALLAIAGKNLQKTTSYVVVMADDPARSIGDTVGYTFGILSQDADISADNTSALLEDIKDGLGGKVDTTTYSELTSLADALYDGNAGAIILNSGYLTALDSLDDYSTFTQDTRIIYEFSTTKELEPIKPNASITSQPFVVYCSGIDARSSDINIQSLSDVNILAVIHPRTHQILLINTPRDYYVPLARNGQRDKLTHDGIDESAAVLGNLYGVKADYYARVNFAGLKKIVDALGGVDVNSDYEFTTVGMEVPNENGDGIHMAGYTFTKGINHLNGEQALCFARERHAFDDGDNQRGKNQMAVIRAIVDKASSPAILKGYQKVLDAVSTSFITSLTYEDISSLVQMQLRDNVHWNITSYSVSGEGGMEMQRPGGMRWQGGSTQEGTEDGTAELPEGADAMPGGGMQGGMMGSDDVCLVYTDDEYESYSNIFNNAKTDVSSSDKDRLIAALKALGEGGDVSDCVDIESVISYFVAHNFVCNFDSYTGTMVHNYYLYEDEGILSMIPWDYNLAFGGFMSGSDAESLINWDIDEPVSGGTIESRPMLAWIFGSEEYTELYHEAFAEFIYTVFTSGEFERLMEETIALISPYVERDPTKFCTYEEFTLGAETLTEFCLLRAESISYQLAGEDVTVDAGDLEISDMGGMSTGGMGGRGR